MFLRRVSLSCRRLSAAPSSFSVYRGKSSFNHIGRFTRPVRTNTSIVKDLQAEQLFTYARRKVDLAEDDPVVFPFIFEEENIQLKLSEHSVSLRKVISPAESLVVALNPQSFSAKTTTLQPEEFEVSVILDKRAEQLNLYCRLSPPGIKILGLSIISKKKMFHRSTSAVLLPQDDPLTDAGVEGELVSFPYSLTEEEEATWRELLAQRGLDEKKLFRWVEIAKDAFLRRKEERFFKAVSSFFSTAAPPEAEGYSKLKKKIASEEEELFLLFEKKLAETTSASKKATDTFSPSPSTSTYSPAQLNTSQYLNALNRAESNLLQKITKKDLPKN